MVGWRNTSDRRTSTSSIGSWYRRLVRQHFGSSLVGQVEAQFGQVHVFGELDDQVVDGSHAVTAVDVN
jgi:hypothetical protein